MTNNTTNNSKINLKKDIIFKAFFSRKGNEEFLIDFLNALLKLEIKKIRIREEVNLEQLSKEEKGGRLDLQAVLNDGLIINIELQIKDEKNIEERTTYYSSKVISRESKRGTDYKDIKQVIMINILDYEMFKFKEYVSETMVVLKEHRDYEVLKGIKWYFIELPKFRKAHNVDMNDKLNQWLAFIDDYRKEWVEMAEVKNKLLKRTRQEMTYLTGDAAVQRLEELREKWEMDRVSSIGFGRRQGIEEGIKQGMEQGIEKGAKQRNKQIARKLKEIKMSIEEISKITELTKEEIKKL